MKLQLICLHHQLVVSYKGKYLKNTTTLLFLEEDDDDG